MDYIKSTIQYELEGFYIEITSRCNLRCLHCYNESGVLKSEISLDVLKKAIDEFDENATITISGGEPLLHPEIWNILQYIRSKGIYPVIVSNATLIDKDVAQRLTKLEIGVQVSLNALHSKEHDLLCGEGNHAKTMRGLNNLIEAGNKKIIVRCILSKANQEEIEDFIIAMAKLTDNIDIGILSIMGRGKEIEDKYDIDLLEKNELLSKIENNSCIKKLKKDGKNIHIPESTCSMGCPLINVPQGEKIPFNPRIDSAGNVFLCQTFDNPLYSIGNINEECLTDIVKSDRMERLVNFLALGINYIENCKECLWNQICGKGCIAQALSKGTIQTTDGDCALRKHLFAQQTIENII